MAYAKQSKAFSAQLDRFRRVVDVMEGNDTVL